MQSIIKAKRVVFFLENFSRPTGLLSCDWVQRLLGMDYLPVHCLVLVNDPSLLGAVVERCEQMGSSRAVPWSTSLSQSLGAQQPPSFKYFRVSDEAMSEPLIQQAGSNVPVVGENGPLESMLAGTMESLVYIRGKRMEFVDDQEQDWEVRVGIVEKAPLNRRVLFLVLVFQASRSRKSVPHSLFRALLQKLLPDFSLVKLSMSPHEIVPAHLSAHTASQTYNHAHLTYQWIHILTPLLKVK
jgi:hypothetical protein